MDCSREKNDIPIITMHRRAIMLPIHFNILFTVSAYPFMINYIILNIIYIEIPYTNEISI